jgi:hypothetical protein
MSEARRRSARSVLVAAGCCALAALLAPLAGGAPAQAKPAAPERPPACAVVQVRSQQSPRAWYRFHATRILGLELETALLGRQKDARAPRLRVYAPDGFLYQVLETSARPRRGGLTRYEARLPVAGTSIMMSGLYGRWRVVPHLDDGREPCGPARSFVIRP